MVSSSNPGTLFAIMGTISKQSIAAQVTTAIGQSAFHRQRIAIPQRCGYIGPYFPEKCGVTPRTATPARTDRRTISMAQQLLMPKATAIWLVDNTALSFDQIAQFCK